MYSTKSLKTVWLIIVLCSIQQLIGQDLYVDQNAKGINNGASWNNAYTRLVDAIASASSGTTIHMAKGIYTGDVSSTAITIDKSLTIIGGYPTGGGDVNHLLNETILDGSKKRRVVNITKKTTLKGLIIQHGKEIDYDGAGLRIASSSVLEDCIIRNNICTKSFGGNVFGGGIYAVFSLKMINCMVLNNSVTNTSTEKNEVKGGGVFIRGTFEAINCLFVNNTAITTKGIAYGAGVFVSKQADIINTLIAYNTATSANYAEAGGLYASGTKGSKSKAIRLKNSILWKNIISVDGGKTKQFSEYSINGPSKEYFSGICSLIKGHQINGLRNIDDSMNRFDPMFVNVNEYNFMLKTSSKLINRGSNKHNTTEKDLNGKTRIQGKIDIGPYEIR